MALSKKSLEILAEIFGKNSQVPFAAAVSEEITEIRKFAESELEKFPQSKEKNKPGKK